MRKPPLEVKRAPELELPSSVPQRAVVAVDWSEGDSTKGTLSVDGHLVARLLWSEGRIEHEQYFNRQGVPHGLERQRDDEGNVIWCAEWRDGVMHGRCMMLDARGRPLAVTHFEQGRGVDIWFGCGEISEVREMAQGTLHGVVRWGDPSAPWDEEYFNLGERHGIFRRWLRDDERLDPDYPQFYVNDERVTREQYDVAQRGDSVLPAYRVEDDERVRELLPAVVTALRDAEVLAQTFNLEDYLRSFDHPNIGADL